MAEGITTKLDFTGFRPEAVDKVRHLLVVLNRIDGHPYLSSRVCLHGGTALNLFFLGAPRLSVDMLDSGDSLLYRRIMLYCASMSAPFPRPFEIANRFAGHEREVEQILYPMLMTGERPSLQTMIASVDPFVTAVTSPKDDAERSYFADAAEGRFRPELLFADYPDVLNAAQHDPAALWKMQNIQKINR
jgi:hypothetical protein